MYISNHYLLTYFPSFLESKVAQPICEKDKILQPISHFLWLGQLSGGHMGHMGVGITQGSGRMDLAPSDP